MTVSANDRIATYTGDGSTTGFAFDFPVAAGSELLVQVRDSGDGGLTTQTLGVHYTVSLNADGTGTATFLSAPAAGDTVILAGATALTQATDYAAQETFPAASHEAAIDKLTRIVQELSAAVARSVRAGFDKAAIIPLPPLDGFAGFSVLVNSSEDGLSLGSAPSSGTISSAMQPVTAAASTEEAVVGLESALSVANNAALAALPAAALSESVAYITRGRSSDGDGGEGVWRWVAADLSTEETADTQNGIYLANSNVATTSGAFVRSIFGDAYISDWFGTDFDALQAAVDQAIADQYPLFVTQIARAIAADETLTLDGPLTMYSADTSTAILTASADRTVAVIHVTGSSADDVTLKDFRIATSFSGTPTNDNENVGILAEAVDDLRIENVEVEGRFYIGIRCVDVTRIWLEGLYVRGALNRLVFIEEDCFDVHIENLTLDGRNAAGDDYVNYCLNISPASAANPRRLSINGVGCQGWISHMVSISETWEEVVVSNVTGVTGTAAAVGFLLQFDSGGSGRKCVVSNIAVKGGQYPVLFTGCDNFIASNILVDAGNAPSSEGAGVYVLNCTNFVLSNVHVKDCADDGVRIYGNTAGLTVDAALTGIVVEGCGGDGIRVDGGASNGARRISIVNPVVSGCTGTGVIATSNTDAVRIVGGSMNNNTAANITNSSANGQTLVPGQTAYMPGTALRCNTIELGADADTTIARGAAGVINVEGQTVLTSDGTTGGAGSGGSGNQYLAVRFGGAVYKILHDGTV